MSGYGWCYDNKKLIKKFNQKWEENKKEQQDNNNEQQDNNKEQQKDGKASIKLKYPSEQYEKIELTPIRIKDKITNSFTMYVKFEITLKDNENEKVYGGGYCDIMNIHGGLLNLANAGCILDRADMLDIEGEIKEHFWLFDDELQDSNITDAYGDILYNIVEYLNREAEDKQTDNKPDNQAKEQYKILLKDFNDMFLSDERIKDYPKGFRDWLIDKGYIIKYKDGYSKVIKHDGKTKRFILFDNEKCDGYKELIDSGKSEP